MSRTTTRLSLTSSAIAATALAALIAAAGPSDAPTPTPRPAPTRPTAERHMTWFSSIVAHWKLDAAALLADAAGANTLTNNGGVTTAAGKLGEAASLNGTSQSLSAANNAGLQTGDNSFGGHAWVYPTAVDGQRIIVSKDGFFTPREYLVDLSGGVVRFLCFHAGGGGLTTLTGPTLPTGAWARVAWWFDQSAKKLNLKVDNRPTVSVVLGGSQVPVVDTAAVVIGGRAQSGFEDFFAGRIDSVTLFKGGVPTDDELFDLYNLGNGYDYPFTGPAPVRVPVTSPSLYASPYNWDSDGGGSLAANNVRAGSTVAVSTHPGSYLKTKITGSYAGLRVDVSAMDTASLGAAAYPKLFWRIAGVDQPPYQLVPGDTLVTLGTGLAAGTKTLEVYFRSVKAVVNTVGDRWVTPVTAVRTAGLVLAPGAAATAPTLRGRVALVYGDSITEGYATHDADGTIDTMDATKTWVWPVAAQLDAEVGVVAYSSQGYTVGTGDAMGGVPAVPTAWPLYSAGRSRLVGGLLSPAPDYLLTAHLTNDAGGDGATVRAAVQQQNVDWRAAAPAARILNLVPPGQPQRANLTQAVADYKAAHPSDARVYLIDVGVNVTAGSGNSYDALHLSEQGQTQYGSLLVTAIAGAGLPAAPALSVSGPGGAIVNGGTVALGTVLLGSVQGVTLTLANAGNEGLLLATVTHGAGLTVTADPSGQTLAPAGTATLTLSVETTTAGAFSRQVTIPSNDLVSPFQFNVTGTVNARPTVTAAAINSAGNALAVTYSESVTGVAAADYALSGHTLGAVTGSGASRAVAVSPVVGDAESLTLAYSGTRTVDGNGAALLAFAGLLVTNNSTVDLTPPDAMTGLTVAPSNRTNTLAWNATVDADRATVRVYRDNALLATLAGSAAGYRDEGLTGGTTYHYRISAVDAVTSQSDTD